MDQVRLATLQANAERILQQGDKRRHAEARAVLEAIAKERVRRTNEERERRSAAKAAIRSRVEGMGLFERVVTAFSDLPPADWEAEVLNAIARNPGRRGDFLARKIGRQTVSYINLAVGSLCSAREHYLEAVMNLLQVELPV